MSRVETPATIGPAALAAPRLTGSPPSPWVTGRWEWPRVPGRLFLLAVGVQLAVVLLSVRPGLDARVFQAAGYLVGTGQSPYVPADLRQVFHDQLYARLPAIGYPPPWPLVLGGIYRLTHALLPDLAVYNAAAKLPVVAANVGLGYLAGAALHNLGAAPAVVRTAWVALLFNPLVIFVGAAWGQIDAIVALLALAALLLAAGGRCDLSAVTMALAVCVKPTAAGMLVAVLLFAGLGSLGRALRYAAVFAAAAAVLYILPFFAFGWDASPARVANAQFSMAGAMSYTTLARLWTGPLTLQGHWWLAGLAWVPAVAVAAVLARRIPRDPSGLLAAAAGLSLVFFLCRTWLSEPNVILVLAPVLVLAALGRVDRRLFTALWAVTLAFAVANGSPAQLLWLVAPHTTEAVLAAVRANPDITLTVRAVLVVAWQVAGWWTVAACLRPGRLQPASLPSRATMSGSVADTVAEGADPPKHGMRRVFDLGERLALALPEPGDEAGPGEHYPTSGLRKGLLLLVDGRKLDGEGVGFGVPVLKRGARAVFAGSAEVTVDEGTPKVVTVAYVLDRVERLGGRTRSIVLLRPLDWAREAFALLYRRVVVTYRVLGDGDLRISADLSALPAAVSEVVLMNELDAGRFDRCIGTDGEVAERNAIGAWNPVHAASCRFVDRVTGVAFELDRDPDPDAAGVRLYRGREVAGRRLSWAGFGYVMRTHGDAFSYSVRFTRPTEGT
jgi:hypothetical protein